MAQQIIGVGTVANDGTGDNLRTAGQKINANFTEVYGLIAALEDPHFLGLYASSGALTTAHPTASPGDYAYVDAGAASPVEMWLWDNDDTEWVQSGSGPVSPPDASETVKGIIEIATQAEVTTGTDDVRAITPLKLATANAAKAPLASPTFTGTPAAPTPAEGDRSTTLATTEFVKRSNVGSHLYLYTVSF